VKTLFYGGPGRKIWQDASGPAIVHHADGTDKGIPGTERATASFAAWTVLA
jgi:hypothetical protein